MFCEWGRSGLFKYEYSSRAELVRYSAFPCRSRRDARRPPLSYSLLGSIANDLDNVRNSRSHRQTVANDVLRSQGRTAGGGRRARGMFRRRRRCRRRRPATEVTRLRPRPRRCSSARSARSASKTPTSSSVPANRITSSASPAPGTPSSDSKDLRLVTFC